MAQLAFYATSFFALLMTKVEIKPDYVDAENV